MTMNKTLLALALGFALAACSNSPQADGSAAEATDAAGEAQQATDNAAATGGDSPAATQAAADAAKPAQDSAEEATAPATAKTNNVPQVDAFQTAVAAKGKALYEATCVACHGPKGKGAIPGVPDLAQGGRLAKPDAEVTANILNGFQSKGSPMAMPAKGGNPNLTAADAKALVVYLRTLTQ